MLLFPPGSYIVKISDFGSSRTQSVNHSTTPAGRATDGIHPVGWQAREVLQSDKQNELKRNEVRHFPARFPPFSPF